VAFLSHNSPAGVGGSNTDAFWPLCLRIDIAVSGHRVGMSRTARRQWTSGSGIGDAAALVWEICHPDPDRGGSRSRS